MAVGTKLKIFPWDFIYTFEGKKKSHCPPFAFIEPLHYESFYYYILLNLVFWDIQANHALSHESAGTKNLTLLNTASSQKP